MNTRQRLRQCYLADEADAIKRLRPLAQWQEGELAQVNAIGRELITAIRDDDGIGLLDAFLQEYSLSNEEGIALMCLAEAMMRVPDGATIDELIYDKFARTDWRDHIGKSDSFWVNASTWGMLFTGKMTRMGRQDKRRLSEKLASTARKLSEPVIRKATLQGVKIMGQQFILGQDIDEAMQRGKTMEDKGYRYSFDMLGEAAKTEQDAERYFQSYVDALERIGQAQTHDNPLDNSGLSVKLSAIHPRYEVGKRKSCVAKLVERMLILCEKAQQYNLGLTIDAEEAWRLELSMDVIEALCQVDSIKQWQGLGLAVQAYQKRCPALLDWLMDLGERYHRRFMVRLVKGAYWDSEIKWYQEQGLENYPVFTRKENTDVSYLACARKMLAAPQTIYPQFATHNAHTIAAIFAMTANREVNFEMQRLHGMGEALHAQFVEHGTPRQVTSRIYAPVGTHKDLLSYLVRRLLENGANSSFVHHLSDEDVSIEQLLADPIATVQNRQDDDIPNPHIALPADILPQRDNSKGLDLTHMPQVEAIETVLNDIGDWHACSLVNNHPSNHSSNDPSNNKAEKSEQQAVFSPADQSRQIGTVIVADNALAEKAMTEAEAAFADWQATPVSVRAALLRQFADALEANMDDWLRLCVYEAGKIWPDAVAEVREAVDFCRYYANQAAHHALQTSTQARGVWVCISPWNFPLAIFIGQIAAALVSGNTVIAKPAEQTPLIAHRAVSLMHEVGIPRNVVQLVLGGGDIGAALTNHPTLAGVAFTGSTATAKKIQQTLLTHEKADHKPRTLIAETGGQNAMVIDSTALPEQVSDAVMTSAFQSAGQRCSALRVLCIQDDIYDEMLQMIKGALATLKVGDTVDQAVDVGPVIDEEALKSLQAYVQENRARVVLSHAQNIDSLNGFFMPPTILEINDISDLGDEQFGPVLHVLRYQASELEALIDGINKLGFGLTGALHSRIEARQEWFINHLQVGNVYINRNQIGAIVGSQPFGGHGLSGTGPKAGGPLYLPRFRQTRKVAMTQHSLSGDQQTVSTNASLNALLDELAAAQLDWAQHASRRAGDIATALSSDLSRFGQDVPSCFANALAAIATQACARAQTSHMPGVTGEDNQYRCYPRGVLLHTHQQPNSQALLQIVAALLMGNAVLVVDLPTAWQQWLVNAGIPENVISGIGSMNQDGQTLNHPALGGLMLSGQSDWTAPIREQWLQRDGAIIPVCDVAVVLKNDNGELQLNPDMLSYLCYEQSISINTAATGGDIELLSLG